MQSLFLVVLLTGTPFIRHVQNKDVRPGTIQIRKTESGDSPLTNSNKHYRSSNKMFAPFGKAFDDDFKVSVPTAPSIIKAISQSSKKQENNLFKPTFKPPQWKQPNVNMPSWTKPTQGNTTQASWIKRNYTMSPGMEKFGNKSRESIEANPVYTFANDTTHFYKNEVRKQTNKWDNDKEDIRELEAVIWKARKKGKSKSKTGEFVSAARCLQMARSTYNFKRKGYIKWLEKNGPMVGIQILDKSDFEQMLKEKDSRKFVKFITSNYFFNNANNIKTRCKKRYIIKKTGNAVVDNFL